MSFTPEEAAEIDAAIARSTETFFTRGVIVTLTTRVQLGVTELPEDTPTPEMERVSAILKAIDEVVPDGEVGFEEGMALLSLALPNEDELFIQEVLIATHLFAEAAEMGVAPQVVNAYDTLVSTGKSPYLPDED